MDESVCMKPQILNRYNLLSRFERGLRTGVFLISLILIPLLLLFAYVGNPFIQFIYEHHSLPFCDRLIQHSYPLEHYFAIKKEVAFHVFILWSLLVVAVSALINLYRFFFSDKKLHLLWIIFICCLVTTIIFLYNTEMKVISVHTFFYAGPVYQILNGYIPPLDPLFGGEILHYQWGHPWAAACLSKILNVTPFNSFEIINILSLAGCIWLLYKISNLLIDDPKINVFSALFPIYCGTYISNFTLPKLVGVIPFYGGENRIFPLLTKFHSFNGIPLGLVFFLMLVYGTMKLFEKKKTVLYSFLVLAGGIGTLFFYAAFGPGILAWYGFMGLLWLIKYKDDDFKAFGRTLLLLYILIFLSVLVVSPYLKQLASSGGFLKVDFCNPRIALQNIFNFLLPGLLSFSIIIFFRKYLIYSLERRNLSVMGCLFLSNMSCYLFSHIPSNGEYKFLLLAMIPFGIIGGIAFTRVQHYSKWLALGLFLLLSMPTLQLCRYEFSSSPRKMFNARYIPSFQENGTILESRDSEENAMYRWIRENTSLDTYFIDKETRIPVYAQRSLWIGFETGKPLPGYDMGMFRLKFLHGYDDREYSQRQEVVQNIFGSQRSLTEQEIAVYIIQKRLFVVVRDNNVKIPLERYGLCEVFTSETGRFRIIASVVFPAAQI
jgi:hypothetical protein